MISSIQKLILPEGVFSAQTMSFDSSDDKLIKKLYFDWIDLSLKLRSLGGRGVNLPEVLSEAVFCRATNAVRINSSIPGTKSSFDCFDLKRNMRIQVKACSVLPDLTSFGPNSVWDELYFMDFYNKGKWDGSIEIYYIPNDLIYNHKVNANQTMKEQQLLGRRPRFSIYKEIILANRIMPKYTFKIK